MGTIVNLHPDVQRLGDLACYQGVHQGPAIEFRFGTPTTVSGFRLLQTSRSLQQQHRRAWQVKRRRVEVPGLERLRVG